MKRNIILVSVSLTCGLVLAMLLAAVVQPAHAQAGSSPTGNCEAGWELHIAIEESSSGNGQAAAYRLCVATGELWYVEKDTMKKVKVK